MCKYHGEVLFADQKPVFGPHFLLGKGVRTSEASAMEGRNLFSTRETGFRGEGVSEGGNEKIFNILNYF